MRNGVRIKRRSEHGAVIVARELLDAAGDLCAEADEDTARAGLNGGKLRFVTVAGDDHVVLFDVVFHDVRVCDGNDDVAVLENGIGVADEHFGFQRFQNVAVRRFGFCNHGAVLIFHVGRGNVVDGDDAV